LRAGLIAQLVRMVVADTIRKIPRGEELLPFSVEETKSQFIRRKKNGAHDHFERWQLRGQPEIVDESVYGRIVFAERSVFSCKFGRGIQQFEPR
jgi:hypothetical protein